MPDPSSGQDPLRRVAEAISLRLAQHEDLKDWPAGQITALSTWLARAALAASREAEQLTPEEAEGVLAAMYEEQTDLAMKDATDRGEMKLCRVVIAGTDDVEWAKQRLALLERERQKAPVSRKDFLRDDTRPEDKPF